MSSPSSLLLPENGEDWPIRMFVLVTPWAWPAPTANTQASAPTAAVHVRIIVIAPRYGENRPLRYRPLVSFGSYPRYLAGHGSAKRSWIRDQGHTNHLALCGDTTRPADSRSSAISTD